MSAIRHWMISVGTDAAFAALFVAWQAHGIERAGYVFTFYAWAMVVLRLLATMAYSHGSEVKPRPTGFQTYHAASEAAFIGAMAWAGHFWLAGISLFVVVLMEGARGAAEKKQEKQS